MEIAILKLNAHLERKKAERELIFTKQLNIIRKRKRMKKKKLEKKKQMLKLKQTFKSIMGEIPNNLQGVSHKMQQLYKDLENVK